jgi:hypothetical protein
VCEKESTSNAPAQHKKGANEGQKKATGKKTKILNENEPVAVYAENIAPAMLASPSATTSWP